MLIVVVFVVFVIHPGIVVVIVFVFNIDFIAFFPIVDVFDIILCRKAITDQLTNEEVRYFADVNGDGDTGVSDLVMLYSFVSGKNNDMAKAE